MSESGREARPERTPDSKMAGISGGVRSLGMVIGGSAVTKAVLHH